MTKRRATRTVVLSDADRLEHVHPRRLRDWMRELPTHACEKCQAEFHAPQGKEGDVCPKCFGGRIAEIPEYVPEEE